MKLINIYPLLPDEFMVYQRVKLYNGTIERFPIEIVRKPVCEYLDYEVLEIVPSRKYTTDKEIIGVTIA